MYRGMDVTWYLQRSCCVINENRMLGEKWYFRCCLLEYSGDAS